MKLTKVSSLWFGKSFPFCGTLPPSWGITNTAFVVWAMCMCRRTPTNKLLKNNIWGKINIKKIKSQLLAGGYPNNLIEKNFIWCQVYRKVIGINWSKKTQPQTNIAFRNAVSTISAQPQTCFNGKMALNTKPAFPLGNLQRATTNFL